MFSKYNTYKEHLSSGIRDDLKRLKDLCKELEVVKTNTLSPDEEETIITSTIITLDSLNTKVHMLLEGLAAEEKNIEGDFLAKENKIKELNEELVTSKVKLAELSKEVELLSNKPADSVNKKSIFTYVLENKILSIILGLLLLLGALFIIRLIDKTAANDTVTYLKDFIPIFKS